MYQWQYVFLQKGRAVAVLVIPHTDVGPSHWVIRYSVTQDSRDGYRGINADSLLV